MVMDKDTLLTSSDIDRTRETADPSNGRIHDRKVDFKEAWKKTLLPASSSILDAVKVINESSMKTAVVVDESMRLLGIVTDGDIRRALLDGKSLEGMISTVLNRNPTVAFEATPKAQRLKLMQASQLISLPILSADRRVIGLDLLSTIMVQEKRKNPVFLMAGGFGTRLKPLTDSCPKPLLQVGGKPILEFIVEAFAENGFQNLFISVHYLPGKIQDHFNDGSKWGVNITYLNEEKPLGTAGALGQLPPLDADLPLIMMNADLLTSVNFESLLDFHKSSQAIATVGVRQYDFQVPYGVLSHTRGDVLEIVEKPIHQFFVNAGIYVLEPEIYKSVPKETYLDMPTLLNGAIAKSNRVTMFPIHEYWLDIGKKNDFEKAQAEYDKFFQ